MIEAIITDIEGTTSSLSFVKDVLFPYARERLPGYVNAHAKDPAVRPLLADARKLAGDEALSLERLIGRLQSWIDEDRKVIPLKELQGMVWEEGYQGRHFFGHVYRDARDAIQRWREQGLKIYVYSSGSVKAQKLLFAHTEYGDITNLFDGYFDTRIGAKIDGASYRRIADEIGQAPSRCLFLSDVETELDAARTAGMNTAWLVRGSRADKAAAHRQYEDFTQIKLDGFEPDT
jgi:enolase-phosphatase E1